VAAPRILLSGLDSDLAPDVVAPLKAAAFDVRFGAPEKLNDGGEWALVVSGSSLPGAGAATMASAAAIRGLATLSIVRDSELASAGDPPPGTAVLVHPFEPAELVHLARRLALEGGETAQPVLGQKSPHGLMAELAHAHAARRAGLGPEAFVASVRLHELDAAASPLPHALRIEAAMQAFGLLELDALREEQAAVLGDELLLYAPGAAASEVHQRLLALRDRVVQKRFWLNGQLVKCSPVMGYAALGEARDADDGLAHAHAAAAIAESHFDLEPARHDARAPAARAPRKAASALRRWAARHQVLLQFVQTSVFGLGIPFLLYWGLDRAGLDISPAMYVFVVSSLALTALFIWIEGYLALERRDPPESPGQPYPPATAIIAAYLPNEAPIIEDTIAAFLRLRYPGPLQVILAYNTPQPMPIEERLQAIAREHPNFVPMRVQRSTSKAQNVNAALPFARGAFTAVFDADHQPDPDSFRRAWRWLSHGADVVQGHCFIRNGDASWVARMVAVEFENIYAVSHPGRARLHGFGIFGGSNGYWRTELLWRLRMHGFMLTEDIDSSMRAVISGHRIVSDPYLVSRELAPETMNALMKQRLRWAQGWFQISRKWIVPGLRARSLTTRQKLGLLHLLTWREVYPWIAMQILPLIAFWALRAGGLDKLDWFVPLFVVTTLFTMCTGPGQVLFTYRLADPQIKARRGWFVFYVLAGVFFYAGLKNTWARIAQLKEFRGESAWNVTTRVREK
jgi:cellulose synthase/poly-beta-1,6-N-acetylglucosamine synthase-like glycosyltransferase